MGKQLEPSQTLEVVSGSVVTQEQAVLGLLGKLHRDLKTAESAVFQIIFLEALNQSSSNLAHDVGEARCALMMANRTMKNIDELGVCFPDDVVKREDWRWVPAKGGN